MKKIKTVIIDDEQHAIDVLMHYAGSSPDLDIVGQFTDPVEGFNFINQGEVDLAFLDIEMQQLSGLDLAELLQGKCKVIFSTAYSKFAPEGYMLDVVDYLVKPVSLARFLSAVEK